MSVIRVRVTGQTSSCSFSELCDNIIYVFHIGHYPFFYFLGGKWETNQYKNKVLMLSKNKSLFLKSISTKS